VARICRSHASQRSADKARVQFPVSESFLFALAMPSGVVVVVWEGWRDGSFFGASVGPKARRYNGSVIVPKIVRTSLDTVTEH
jgi:hypothetical protein